MEWISVEDRLPESMDIYITGFDNGGVWISVFTNEKIWIDENGKDLSLKVTHWMPFPKHPEE